MRMLPIACLLVCVAIATRAEMLVPAGPDRAAGQWGEMRLDPEGAGRAMTGVRNEDGAVLALACPPAPGRGGSPVLLLGPVPAAGTVLTGRVDVTGRGALTTLVQFERVEGTLLASPLLGSVPQALRSGDTVRVSVPEAGIELGFGLRGSADALGRLDCVTAPRPGAGSLPYLVHDGDWQVAEQVVEGPLPAPVAASTPGQTQRGRVRVDCLRRLIVPIPGLRGGNVVVSVDGATWTLPATALRPGAADAATAPLPDDLLAAMRGGRILQVTGPAGAAPDAAWAFRVTLDGIGAALDALRCADGPDRTEAPKTDLTGAPGGWRPEDLSEAAGQPWFAASYATDDAPTLLVGCDRTPFFLGGDVGAAGTVHVRFVPDGDADAAQTHAFANYRAFLNPGDDIAALAPVIGSAATLRVEVLENPAIDVLYPLEGLSAALAEAGCSAE